MYVKQLDSAAAAGGFAHKMTVTTPEKRLVQQQVSKHKKVDKAIKKALDAHPSITTPVSTKKSQRRQVLKDRLYDGIDIERIVQGQTRSEILRLRGSTLTFSDCCILEIVPDPPITSQTMSTVSRPSGAKNCTNAVEFPRTLWIEILDCTGCIKGFGIGFISMLFSTQQQSVKIAWDPNYDRMKNYTARTSRDVTLLLKSADEVVDFSLIVDGNVLELSVDASDLPTFKSLKDCTLDSRPKIFEFHNQDNLDNPIHVTLVTRWVGHGSRRDVGIFNYSVVAPAGVETLHFLPDRHRGEITEESLMRERFRYYDDDESGELEAENVMEMLDDFCGEVDVSESATNEVKDTVAERRAQNFIKTYSTTSAAVTLSFSDFCKISRHYKQPVAPSLDFNEQVCCRERFVFPNGDVFVRIDEKRDRYGIGGFTPVADAEQRPLLKETARLLTWNGISSAIGLWYRSLRLMWWIRERRERATIMTRFLKGRISARRWSRILKYAQKVGAITYSKDGNDFPAWGPGNTWQHELGARATNSEMPTVNYKLHWQRMLLRGERAAVRIRKWWLDDMVETGARYWLRETRVLMDRVSMDLEKATSFSIVSEVLAFVYTQVMQVHHIRRFVSSQTLSKFVIISLKTTERLKLVVVEKDNTSSNSLRVQENADKQIVAIRHILKTLVFILYRSKSEAHKRREIMTREVKEDAVKIRNKVFLDIKEKMDRLRLPQYSINFVPKYIIDKKSKYEYAKSAQSPRSEFWMPTDSGSPWYFAYAYNLQKMNPHRKSVAPTLVTSVFGDIALPVSSFGTINHSVTRGRRWLGCHSKSSKQKLLEARKDLPERKLPPQKILSENSPRGMYDDPMTFNYTRLPWSNTLSLLLRFLEKFDSTPHYDPTKD